MAKNSIVLNSLGRVFIQEKPCGKFEYAEDLGVQLGGVTESFGDVTYVYSPSDLADSYEIVGEIGGTETPPTTTITAYMPSDGKSQLIKLAKSKCSFNLQVHWGACQDPTNFSEFDTGKLFEGVKITSYSTTDLTSRGPDSRAPIDLTFNISIQKIVDLKKAKLTQLLTSLGENSNGIIESLLAVTSSDCNSGDCLTDCDLIGIQRRLNSQFRFIRKVGDNWYNTTIVSGVTPNSGVPSYIYSNKNKIYAFINTLSTTTIKIYSAEYSKIANAGITWTQIYSVAGSSKNEYYVYGDKLWFTIANSGANKLGILTLSTGSVETISIPNTPTGIWGYEGTVYIGATGAIYVYKNGVLTDLSSYIPVPGVNYSKVSIFNENSFVVLASTVYLYCTTDGGKSWTLVNTIGNLFEQTFSAQTNPWYVVGLSKVNGTVYESHDGGKTFLANNTYDSILKPISVTFCGDTVYIAAGDTATGTTGAIFESN